MNLKAKQIETLENLFQFVPPSQLRRSITQVFFGFLIHNKEELPGDFDQMAEDIYMLLECLEEMESTSETL